MSTTKKKKSEETGGLIEKVQENQIVLLLDEIEKAHST